MAEVTWSPKALRLWQGIVAYLSEDDPERADIIGEKLVRATDKLSLFPRMGRVVPEFGREDCRELVSVRPYRILYLVVADDCYIIGVVHSRRDLRKVIRWDDLEDLGSV